MDDEDGNDRVYNSNKRSFQSLDDYRKALEYHEKRLKIAIEIGNQAAEERAYRNLGNVYHSLGDY